MVQFFFFVSFLWGCAVTFHWRWGIFWRGLWSCSWCGFYHIYDDDGPKGRRNNLPQPACCLAELFFWSDLSWSQADLCANSYVISTRFSLFGRDTTCTCFISYVGIERIIQFRIMGPRGAPTTCHNQHGASRSYSFGQIWADCKQIFVLIPMWFLRVLDLWARSHRARVIYST